MILSWIATWIYFRKVRNPKNSREHTCVATVSISKWANSVNLQMRLYIINILNDFKPTISRKILQKVRKMLREYLQRCKPAYPVVPSWRPCGIWASGLLLAIMLTISTCVLALALSMLKNVCSPNSLIPRKEDDSTLQINSHISRLYWFPFYRV